MTDEDAAMARFLEPMHDAVREGDHAAAWDMIRQAWRMGRDSATMPLRHAHQTAARASFSHGIGGYGE